MVDLSKIDLIFKVKIIDINFEKLCLIVSDSNKNYNVFVKKGNFEEFCFEIGNEIFIYKAPKSYKLFLSLTRELNIDEIIKKNNSLYVRKKPISLSEKKKSTS